MFYSELRTVFLTDSIAELTGDLVYEYGETRIIVPIGFRTDFASVPRIPGIYDLLGGIARAAAVVHDYLYREGLFDRKTCDDIFLAAMKDQGVCFVKRRLLYWGVRLFGGPYWKGKNKGKEKENGN